HKADCPNLLATDPQRRLQVTWSSTGKTRHRAELRIRAENRRTILAEISGAISADDADIVEFKARTTTDNVAQLGVIVEVADLQHLRQLQRHLQQMPEVIEVRRL
ncbi:MAG TPA: bifunctional (p)ppGpp synthetase/guanosine-3',5'-bis(diphosphate) 3'-pyrophosphohydrolase, partial [Desulfobulbaceae bacterium]|nr:bifunctional (p)ppGpp synthetase/guanosine-3',5'-bis(diphosphate) 3'-pyrophosphohydrolase [Desulfobulbaceae bacterium]